VPIDALLCVKKAHDVRTLRVCGRCEGLGNANKMIDLDGDWFHGRCFVERFGERALAALPKAKRDRLTLGDLGVYLMQILARAEGRSDGGRSDE